MKIEKLLREMNWGIALVMAYSVISDPRQFLDVTLNFVDFIFNITSFI